MIPTDCGSDWPGLVFLFFCSFCRVEWYLGNRWHCRVLPARMREQVPALESVGEPRHLFALGKELHGRCVDLPLSYGTHSNKDWVPPARLDPLPPCVSFTVRGRKPMADVLGKSSAAESRVQPSLPHSSVSTLKARDAVAVVEPWCPWRDSGVCSMCPG